MIDQITNLDQYLECYGALLGEQAQRKSNPLHVPSRDPVWDSVTVKRKPYKAQAHVITAAAKALNRQKSVLIVGEMGTGKTLMAMLAVHAHALGKPYHALVFCPGQLVEKWEREIRETIAGVDVVRINSFHDVTGIADLGKPARPTWWIIARDRAKLSSKWRGAYIKNLPYAKSLKIGVGIVRCPECFEPIVDEDRVPIPSSKLDAKRHNCPICNVPLWTYTHKIDRWEPAKYIHKKLKGFFKYLVLDEVHEEKGADTAQANAAGSLAASVEKVVALTGTLIGGYAEHIRPLLFRLAPGTLVEEGLGWENSMPFNERYGRIETRITEREYSGDDNDQSRGSKRTKTKYVRPGIMPGLFGRHLMDKAVFLGLEEISYSLPRYQEIVEAIELDDEQKSEYKRLESELMNAVRMMIASGDKRMLGVMLRTLLCYVDHPHGWGEIGYRTKDGAWVKVTETTDLDPETIRPKEQRLLEIVQAEKRAGRQCWVFMQMTDKRDCLARLEKLLTAVGLRVKVLRSEVPLEQREAWIAKHGPDCDVVLSHPKLVETGLDLFDKNGGHNFCTLIFYQTGYALFTLRQASRRAWRIGQKRSCKVIYLYYQQTMQERAMCLMGRKMSASQAIEGKFSSEGLAAMAGEDGSIEMALAKSLVQRLDDLDASRAWEKLGEFGYREEDDDELLDGDPGALTLDGLFETETPGTEAPGGVPQEHPGDLFVVTEAVIDDVLAALLCATPIELFAHTADAHKLDNVGRQCLLFG